MNIYQLFAACDQITHDPVAIPGVIQPRPSIVSDLYQTGAFATLHRLKTDNLPQMERDLKTFSSSHPIARSYPLFTPSFAGTP
jgi:hypothetical protein